MPGSRLSDLIAAPDGNRLRPQSCAEVTTGRYKQRGCRDASRLARELRGDCGAQQSKEGYLGGVSGFVPGRSAVQESSLAMRTC